MLVPLFAIRLDWLTPLWLLGVGAAAGAILLALLYGLSRLAPQGFRDGVREFAGESPLVPIYVTALFLAALALFSTPAVPYQLLAEAVGKLPTSQGAWIEEVTAPAGAVKQPIELDRRIPRDELALLSLKSDVPLTVLPNLLDDEPDEEFLLRDLDAGVVRTWSRASGKENPMPGDVHMIYVTNLSGAPATLELNVDAGLEYPEAALVPQTAAALVAVVLLYLLFRVAAPKTSAVALATSKDVMGQPIYTLLTIVGVVILIVLVVVPYNTFGEDVKMLKIGSLPLIRTIGVVVALWAASTSIAEELEGRTALTVLSKPIGRRQFIIGKFWGIMIPVLVMFVILGVVFLTCCAYKVVYDARETGVADVTWRQCHAEMVTAIPGLVLYFFEVMVLASISVAISTRLSLLPNLVICAAVYVVGHLAPLLAMSSAAGDNLPVVQFMGEFLATVFPVLDNFNLEPAIAGGEYVPLVYIGWSCLYALAFTGVALLLALILFEDRDMA